MIRYHGLTQRFQRRCVLENLSLALTAGEVIGLHGDNGAGKTTLLKILCGLEKPQQGAVDFGDGAQAWTRSRMLLLQRVMYLHQHPYLFDGSVSRNLAHALPRALTAAQRQRKIRDGLAWARLENLSEADAKTLSGGEARRIALTRAWLRQAKFLLLDEPFANLDAASQTRAVELLQRLKQARTSMVIASHSYANFAMLLDRRIRLAHGKLAELPLEAPAR